MSEVPAYTLRNSLTLRCHSSDFSLFLLGGRAVISWWCRGHLFWYDDYDVAQSNHYLFGFCQKAHEIC